MTEGKYIVIEGAEGVGKTTMVHKIAQQLRTLGQPVRVMREPDSQNDLTARAIRRLTQDPNYPTTTRTEVLLFNAARSQSLEVIRKARANGVHCLVDRSYLSTLTNQYYGRGDIQDYQKINEIIDFAVGDMQPDLMVVLDAPVAVLRERVASRTNSHGRFGSLDDSFYERVRAGYLWEAKQRNLPVVYANEDIETVFSNVWQHVSTTVDPRTKPGTESQPQSVAEVLAANPPTKVAPNEPPITEQAVLSNQQRPTHEVPIETPTEPSAEQVTETEQPEAEKHDDSKAAIIATGEHSLAEYVTNPTGSVFEFTPAISSAVIAALMSNLSHLEDNIRPRLLEQYVSTLQPQQIASIPGSKKTQQLVDHYIVIEDATTLSTKKLPVGISTTIVKPVDEYMYYDKKDEQGHYQFYIPSSIRGKVRSQYIRTMNQLFDTYSKLAVDLTAHIRATSPTAPKDRDTDWRTATSKLVYDTLRPLLPVAAITAIGVKATNDSLENIIIELLSDELPEAQALGKHILEEAQKATPNSFEKLDKDNAATAYHANAYATVSLLAQQLLPPNHTAEAEAVTLTDYSPRNELDIVADILYEHGDLPLEQLQQETTAWPYQRKTDILSAYIGTRTSQGQTSSRALRKIRYTFDLIADYASLLELQRNSFSDLTWQQLSPRLGYGIPALIDEIGAIDTFEQSFDTSLELYSALQTSETPLEAQYATLFGHKARCKVTYTALEILQLQESVTDSSYLGYRHLIESIYAKVADIHPLLASITQLKTQETI